MLSINYVQRGTRPLARPPAGPPAANTTLTTPNAPTPGARSHRPPALEPEEPEDGQDGKPREDPEQDEAVRLVQEGEVREVHACGGGWVKEGEEVG